MKTTKKKIDETSFNSLSVAPGIMVESVNKLLGKLRNEAKYLQACALEGRTSSTIAKQSRKSKM